MTAARRDAATSPVAYVLKMFPRFSETFILNELLELERQGARLRIFSLRPPDDGVFHADVARVRAPVSYVPLVALRNAISFVRPHARLLAARPRPYATGILRVLTRATSVRTFARAGYIADIVRRERIRHLHAHFASAPTSVALEVSRLLGISYSFTAHAKDIFLETVRDDEVSEKLADARFAVTVSDYNRRHLANVNPAARLVRIYNGLDLERYSANGASPERPPLILAVGRLIEKKGFADLVRACDLLRRDGVSFSCRIVGKGPLEAELRRHVSLLGLEGCVELSGPIPREELVRRYRAASVVVAPCVVGHDGNRDGLPTVLVEAMALGVPVVATAVTGIPELVEDGRTGVIVPERDAEALARAIARVLADPATARRLADAGRERIERDFDLGANVAELQTLLAEAVGV
jgi:colanic acid/amylovoran biosynthesis glycosyltransferase